MIDDSSSWSSGKVYAAEPLREHGQCLDGLVVRDHMTGADDLEVLWPVVSDGVIVIAAQDQSRPKQNLPRGCHSFYTIRRLCGRLANRSASPR